MACLLYRREDIWSADTWVTDTMCHKEGRKEMFYLTTHSTLFTVIWCQTWLRTILIVREETRCRHIGYSFQLAARVLLYALSHRQDSTYHRLCYTSRAYVIMPMLPDLQTHGLLIPCVIMLMLPDLQTRMVNDTMCHNADVTWSADTWVTDTMCHNADVTWSADMHGYWYHVS